MIIQDWKETARAIRECKDGMDWVDITGALLTIAILVAAYGIVGYIEFGM